MKDSMIQAMERQYGKNNKWVILFKEKTNGISDRWTIRYWFNYCDINARNRA